MSKGAKKLTFRAIIIVGDTKRKVGVGVGRADDVNLAMDKAILNGKKNLITVPLTLNYSVHVVKAGFGACSIMIRPAKLGTGVIAGGSVRTVLELAGIKNVVAKQFGSNNILNNAKVTILALTNLNQQIEIGKYQSSHRQGFYDKIMRKYKNARVYKLKRFTFINNIFSPSKGGGRSERKNLSDPASLNFYSDLLIISRLAELIKML